MLNGLSTDLDNKKKMLLFKYALPKPFDLLFLIRSSKKIFKIIIGAKIKILFVSPFPTDLIKSALLAYRENFIDFRGGGGGVVIPEIFSVPFRKREKIICSISIRNTSRITYDFIEGH